MIGTLLAFFIILCIVGLLLWGIRQIPGLPPIVLVVLYVIIGVMVLLWLLSMVQGGGFNGLHFGRVG